MATIKKTEEVRPSQFRVYYDCDYCGFTKKTRLSHFRRKKRHFCSTNCYSLFRKHKLPIKEQHRYGTGFSEEERKKRVKCRSDFNHALRDRKIAGPFPCEVCFTTHDIEAHHDDYDKPLDVRWFCFKHHREHHKKIHENPELLTEASD